MGARTPIAAGLVTLAPDSFTSQGAGQTPDAVNGNTLADPGPNHLMLVVSNGDTSTHTITVRASGSGPDVNGNAQPPLPQNTVFTQSPLGDLVVTIPAGGTYVAPTLTTDRFTQPDGSLSLDWDASTSVKLWAYQLPSNALGGPLL